MQITRRIDRGIDRQFKKKAHTEMKLAYITGDILPNANFAFYHDLLANFPVPDPAWCHRVYLISPTWDRGLVAMLKSRSIDVRSCFEDFQPSTDVYWDKIRQDTEDCDVIISGNITNLDDVIPDSVQKPIVSLSMAERGYMAPGGGYGSFYKPRFYKAAVSKTAVEAFPAHVRERVEVLPIGVDPSRLAQKVTREKVRSNWFSTGAGNMKLALFVGAGRDDRGLKSTIESLEHLPNNWHVIVLTAIKDLNVPDHLKTRVHVCTPTYHIADIYLAADCVVLPTEHEGLSATLLESWFLQVPVVTTRHKAMLELAGKHPDTDFGHLLDVQASPQQIAESILQAKPNPSATECVHRHYMASNMVGAWNDYLANVCKQ